MTKIPADLQALLDQFEPQIRDAFLRAIEDVTSEAQLALLVDAIQRQDVARLYAVLRDAAESPQALIAVAPIPDEGMGRAIRDRLRRAAADQ